MADLSKDSSSDPERPDSLPAEQVDPTDAGSMLRLRDVQALNRAFHHLAEVQDSLLRHLQDGEGRHRRTVRSRTFLTVSLGFVALALVFFTWQIQQGGLFATPEIHVDGAPAPDIQVTSPEIHLPAAQITVEGSGNEVAVIALTEELADLRQRSSEDRARLADLTTLLVAREEAQMEFLNQIGRPSETGSALPVPEPIEAVAISTETNLAPPEAGADLWLRTLNGLLAVDGYGHLEFRSARRVPGKPLLTDVLLLQRRTDGSPAQSIRADRAEFELHRMTRTLVFRLFGGHRSGSGSRISLPEDGIRFDLARIRADVWLEHFPALFDLAPADPAAVEQARLGLESLLTQPRPNGYWKVPVLRSLDGSILQMVQVQRFDSGGRLLRVLEADELEVLIHPNGDVELQFREGAIFEGGQRRPFFEDRFRVYLPREARDAWLTSDIPVVEVR